MLEDDDTTKGFCLEMENVKTWLQRKHGANERSKNRERRQTGVVNFRIVRKCCGNSELFKDDIEEATRSPSTGSERVDNVVKVVSTIQAKYGWLRVVGNGHHTVCDITKIIQKSMSQIKQN